jgi:hypothetical protein
VTASLPDPADASPEESDTEFGQSHYAESFSVVSKTNFIEKFGLQ